MSSSTAEPKTDVRARRVAVTKDQVTVEFVDGRTISVPLAWYPRLLHGSADERANVEIWDDGLYWPELNGDISFKAMLLGNKSGESPKSLKRWLERRAKGQKQHIPTLPLSPTWLKRFKPATSPRRGAARKKSAAARGTTTLKQRAT
jgi:hypothetical protein